MIKQKIVHIILKILDHKSKHNKGFVKLKKAKPQIIAVKQTFETKEIGI